MRKGKVRVFAFGLACFLFGVVVQTGLADKKRVPFNADIYQGKDPKAAATTLLEGALKLAGDGSWERIAVGRAWYLGGDKAKGQEIFDAVTSGKAKNSDWLRIARVYAEAGEWEKAQPIYEKALAAEPDDDSGMIELGALLNAHKQRDKAEPLFTKALTKNPGEFWHWVGAGASYLGVAPQ